MDAEREAELRLWNEIAGKASDAVGVTPYSDMRPFIKAAVIWALEDLRERHSPPPSTQKESEK